MVVVTPSTLAVIVIRWGSHIIDGHLGGRGGCIIDAAWLLPSPCWRGDIDVSLWLGHRVPSCIVCVLADSVWASLSFCHGCHLHHVGEETLTSSCRHGIGHVPCISVVIFAVLARKCCCCCRVAVACIVVILACLHVPPCIVVVSSWHLLWALVIIVFIVLAWVWCHHRHHRDCMDTLSSLSLSYRRG